MFRLMQALRGARFAALAITGLLISFTASNATTITATSWGNWNPGGFASCCYNIGFDQGGVREFRSYFNFDLSGLSGTPIYGATLSLFEPSAGYAAALSSISFSVGSTPVGSSFASVAGGAVYGSGTVTSADSNSDVLITLNAAAIADLIAGEGGIFAIGGYTTGVIGDNQIFSSTGSAPAGSVKLILDTVPEPASLAVIGVGLAGLGFARRRMGQRG